MTALLDSMEFVIVPIVNPDGYVVSWSLRYPENQYQAHSDPDPDFDFDFFTMCIVLLEQ